MARSPRTLYAGALAHITMHGADGITLFPEARDAQAFLTHLGDISTRHSVEVHCYCLMSTHYHLLVRDTNGGISAAMSQLNG